MNSDTTHFFELLLSMTERELRSRYKYTVLGFFWLVANPLLQMFIIGFIFTFFVKQPIEHYYYFLFIGLLVWNFFSLSLSKATPSIVHERALIKKTRFPYAVIPLSIILSNLIHFGAALLLYIIPVLFIHTLSLASFFFAAAALFLLVVFTVGISLATSALNVKYRDVSFFVQSLLMIWFYATPIVYSLAQIPNRFLWLWRLNPLTTILQLFQQAFLRATPPGPAMLLINISVIVITLCVGIRIFQKESITFDDWI